MTPAIDPSRVEAFAGQILHELGAAYNAALVVLGDRLGLWRAMADAEPVSSVDLAARTRTHERYVREWLRAQAASGFVAYDQASDRYTLPAEHAMVLADETSPVLLTGGFQMAMAVMRSEAALVDRFRTGAGLGWHEHDSDLHEGCERAFAATYRGHLVSQWIPALEGVEAKLARGARVADVGCGHGAATILMAQAFPNSTFVGFDYHPGSIATARARAAAAGVADRVRFEVGSATDFPGDGYDLVTVFDALHDMGDPVATAAHVRRTLAPGGTWMVVEPMARDEVTENLHPVGRLYYAISTAVCTPNSLAQPGRAGLGTQAGPAGLRDVIEAGGFSTVRCVAETPLNLVLEASP
jgi:SAM-dependent methyltransferase